MILPVSLLALLGTATAVPSFLPDILGYRIFQRDNGWDACSNEQNVNGKYPVNTSQGAFDKGWMSLGCSIKEIEDKDQQYTAQQMWDAADATDALAQTEVCGLLVQSQKTNTQSYSSAVSKFLNGPPGFNCDQIDNSGGATTGCNDKIQCTESGHAAGWQIINSFVAIRNANQGIYDDMEVAKTNIIGRVGKFSDNFSPKIDELKELKIILDIVAITFMVSASLLWNLVAKAIVPAAGKNLLDATKDFTNGMVSTGLTTGKDVQKDRQDKLGTQNSLSDMATNLIEAWRALVVSSNQGIFGGHANSSTLAEMIDKGQVIGVTGPSQQDIENNLEQTLWATMMPWAWQRSTEGYWPVVITPTHPDASKGCNGWDAQTEAYMSASDGQASFVCIDNSPYWLASVHDPHVGASCHVEDDDGDSSCQKQYTLPLLPGNDQMQPNNKPWGGVTIQDLVAGAVATYKKNGNKNGTPALNVTDLGTIEDFATNGIRAAGFTNFPICSGRTAWVRWGTNPEQQNMDVYPCDPLTGDLAHCDDPGWGGC